MNPSIITVTGRPRRPNDQGSVENMNKLAKRMLQSAEDDRLKGNKKPNWTSLLSNVQQLITCKVKVPKVSHLTMLCLAEITMMISRAQSQK